MNRSKVPDPTLSFWVAKVLTTGMGEALSDFMVRHFDPYLTVGITAVVFAVVLVVQIAAKRYIPWLYWAAVVMVGVFGTMVADAAHVAAGIPYFVSAPVFLVVLIAVFVVWQRTEHTVDVHAIDTLRRELLYWSAVVATFALGTAAGDLAAYVFGLGFLVAGLMFTSAIVVVVLARAARLMAAVPAFWIAYILTRPVGASFADWFAVEPSRGGLGVGTGAVSAILGACIVAIVAWVSVRHERARRVALVTRSAS
ncbi:COG4705 family protein [Curtobacterium ammoniigenes]|uniref:COG4705 family protein n=1 Tax=Curtobacterium ammoniigenes TaxID=395387 RepID=UPI00082A579B|nr:hypothetical protein [Curtobacterium ammoniigenes]